jgi:tyrosyl-tRNA synthetase
MKKMTKQEIIKDIITRGVEEIIVKADFEKALNSKKKLRIKFGIDPTAPDIHLGHTVSLRKLRQFQQAGHQVILIIGDYTAAIGDPTGRSELRKQLSRDEVNKNLKNYLSEIGKILDLKKTEVHHNSEWFDKMTTLELYELTSKVTVAQVLDRDDFKNRLANDQDVSMLETFYPLFQGYDSVAIKSDVEIGGTDQKFNLLMGRKLQKRYHQSSQNIMTVPIIEGLDGVRKMSKSYDNYIGVSESPESMFGKVMSIPDGLVIKYFRLLTDYPTKEIEKMKKTLELPGSVNPRDYKVLLAKEIVREYHGDKAAQKAQDDFEKKFVKKEIPDDIPTIKLKKATMFLTDILVDTKMADSKSEARRLIEQGGVRVDGATLGEREAVIEPRTGMVIQVGKRKFIKVK